MQCEKCMYVTCKNRKAVCMNADKVISKKYAELRYKKNTMHCLTLTLLARKYNIS